MSIQAPSQHIQTWLEKIPAQQKPTVMALRALIGALAPDAREIVYHDALCYSPADAGFDPIVYIAVFSAHINLGFYYGGALRDPEGLLLGAGKRMRHITIRSLPETTHPDVGRLLQDAWTAGPQRSANGRRV